MENDESGTGLFQPMSAFSYLIQKVIFNLLLQVAQVI